LNHHLPALPEIAASAAIFRCWLALSGHESGSRPQKGSVRAKADEHELAHTV
jgi:hypothetical protein